MFCGKCGNQLIDGAKYCNRCGASVILDAFNEAIPTESCSLINKSDYYKHGYGGKKYKTAKIIAIISLIYQCILAALGMVGCFYLLRFAVAVTKYIGNFSSWMSVFVYPIELVIFFGLFLLLQIRGIKKNSTGRYISAMIFGFFNTCNCCGLFFNKPLINISVLIVWLGLQIAIIVLLISCNKKYKMSLIKNKEI